MYPPVLFPEVQTPAESITQGLSEGKRPRCSFQWDMGLPEGRRAETDVVSAGLSRLLRLTSLRRSFYQDRYLARDQRKREKIPSQSCQHIALLDHPSSQSHMGIWGITAEKRKCLQGLLSVG